MDGAGGWPYSARFMLRSFCSSIPALLLASAAPAQIIPLPLDNSSIAPQPTPTPEPTPAPTPTAEPTATPTPTPAPTATPEPARPATPRPTATRTPVVGQPAPDPLPSPSPVPTPSAAPATPIETVVLPQPRPPASRGAPIWPWLFGGAAVLAGLALLLLRRRAEPVEEVFEPEPGSQADDVPDTAPVTAPTGPAPAMFSRAATPAPDRARLSIDVRPTRAGLNLLTATVEAEVTVTNTGDVPSQDIRAAVVLLSAGSADDAVTAFNTAPVTRPVTPPFALAPGEQRRFRAVVALPHDEIKPLQAAGRPIFVPLVAVTLRHRDAGGDRYTSQSWGVGVERVDSAKLAPFWLDVPARRYEQVAARAQGALRED